MQIVFEHISKHFGKKGSETERWAVNDVSWQAAGGRVLGILGPNGAGKTTMLRILLNMMRADRGVVHIDRQPHGNANPNFKLRVGYLPEERGLYRKRRIIDVLVYLGALKGMGAKAVKARAKDLLRQLELEDYAEARVDALSKGMAQKLQLAAALIHDPELVILDEPFSGLDPVNVRLVRELVRGLRQEGRCVLLATHMMAEVEVACDDILMIHRGRDVLSGPLHDVKARFGQEILLDAQADPSHLPSVERFEKTMQGCVVHLNDGATVHQFLGEMAAAKRPLRRFESRYTPLEDIFVQVVHAQNKTGAL